MGHQVQCALLPAVMMEKYVKSVIDVFVYVIESDGSGATLANAINCSVLALVDAGIEMYDLVSASSVTMVDNLVLVDATAEEEERRSGTIVLAVMPSTDQISHVLHQGMVDSKKAINVLFILIINLF